VTLTLGIQLLNRVAEKLGHASAGKSGPLAFPTAGELARAEVPVLRSLGLSGQKATAMVQLGRQVIDGRIDLEGLCNEDDQTVVAWLLELRGIGRWSAEYALLRGLGRVHVFPGDDVGARRQLEKRLRLAKALDYARVGKRLHVWRDYAA